MSEYIVQRNSLVNIADEIRVLSGTMAELGLDEMKTCVSDANAEVEIHEALLDEIISILPVVLPARGTPLNDLSWEDISLISQEGQAANYFSVGDTKEIIISGTVGNTTFNNLSVWGFILGFNHNSDIEGSNTIHFQIGKTAQTGGTNICLIDEMYNSRYTSAGDFTMNNSAANSGGWESSTMRTVLLGSNYAPSSPLSDSLMAALPGDLRAAMKGVTKYSDNTGGGSNTASYVTSTTDYLWLLAEYEVFGTRSHANSAEQNYQAQYDYYANGNSKTKYGLKYYFNITSDATYWWLRSTNATNSYSFCYADDSDVNFALSAYYSLGVAPAFCV